MYTDCFQRAPAGRFVPKINAFPREREKREAMILMLVVKLAQKGRGRGWSRFLLSKTKTVVDVQYDRRVMFSVEIVKITDALI